MTCSEDSSLIPQTGITPDYKFIDNERQLAPLIEQCLGSDWVAIDTEFVRTKTYYPQIGLIQLATPSGFYLLDPLAFDNPDPLAELLVSPDVTKIMHACSEDLEVFQYYLGVLPTPLFDTQIAASLLGYGLSVGYKKLVESIYNVVLPKDEQRSNWRQRPLSEAQQDYAVMDVVYLRDIYLQQLAELKQKQRLAWVQEECQHVLDKQRREMPVTEQYRRVKGAGVLESHELGVLQALAAWREGKAQQRNIPRGFLLKDRSLVQLAQQQPTTLQGLSQIDLIHAGVIRKDGAQLLELIERAKTSDVTLKSLDNSLARSAKPWLKQIQKLVADKAAEVEIPPELIMNRKTMAAMLTHLLETGEPRLSNGLSRWKIELVGTELLALLKSFGDG